MTDKKFPLASIIIYLVLAIILIVGLIFLLPLGSDKFVGNGEGFKGPLSVSIAVKDGVITDAKLDSFSDSVFAEPSANEILAQAVEKGNPNDLDVVAGATYTSNGVITALQSAYREALGNTTFTGKGEGFKGPLAVTIEVKGGKIVEAELSEFSDSEFAVPSAEAVITQALEKGSADNLDVVAGATYTSTGVINALKSAYNQSQGKPADQDMIFTDTTTDVVIIGAGGAGLSAAVAASESGANVIILEKMSIAGGNTNYATGGLNASETSSQKAKGIEDSNEQFYEDTMVGGGNINNPELVQVFVENSAETVDWLQSYGMDLSDVGFMGGSTNSRTHRPTGGAAIGSHFTSVMVEAAENAGAEIRYNNEVTEIINTNGKATGVKVSTKEGDYTITADAVIVATGGFGANAELVASFVPSLEGFGTTNHAGATGDGIELAENFDAGLVDIEQIQTHPTVVPVKNIMITEAVRGNGAIMINREGQRFEEEMSTRDVMSSAILAQTGKTAFLVFDQGIRESLKAIEGYATKGLLTQGETLAELETNLGIPAGNLEATVVRYNGFVDAKSDPDFGRESFPRKLSTGPFYAVEVAPAVHHTMGGLEINVNAEVIDANGDVIEGLYAAGEVTGGIHGANRLGGNAVSDIATFGRIAGVRAAEFVK